MSTPYYIILTDSDDEQLEPETIIIPSDSENESPPSSPLFGNDESLANTPICGQEGLMTDEESEEESLEEEEEEDPEEDPEEDMEEDSEEEDPEEEPEEEHPEEANEETEGPPPTADPYLPQSYHPIAEGSAPPSNEASSSAPPTLDARIGHIEDYLEATTGMTSVGELQKDIWTLEQHFQRVEDYTHQMGHRIAQDPNRLKEIERRLDGMEQSLEKLHNMADTMGSYANYILKGDHIPK